MAVLNFFTKVSVGLALLLAAANFYDSRVAKPQMQKAAIATQADMANARATLPKWQDQ